MLKWLMHFGTRQMEKATSYDATYMHEVIDQSTSAGFKLSLLPLLSQHKEDAPLPLWYGAALASVLEGDCGPCAQLMVDQGLKQGVSPAILRALVARDMDMAGNEASLGFRYAEAVMADHIEAATMRDEILSRYGERTLIALAFATAFCRTYPVLKRGLGHGAACQKIRIGEKMEAVVKQAA
ncbi:MAG: hypothetical protein RLN89_07520 [Parvibaculum sp.]